MTDNTFSLTADSTSAPATFCFEIAPSSNDDLSAITKAIYVGSGGNVVILPLTGDVPVTFRNVPSGSVLPVRVRAVRAEGTTATNIVGLA